MLSDTKCTHIEFFIVFYSAGVEISKFLSTFALKVHFPSGWTMIVIFLHLTCAYISKDNADIQNIGL